MLFQTSSFEKRAAFLYRNICDFPAELALGRIEGPDREEILEGLRYFNRLLKDIYGDTKAFRVEDDLESYHRLTQTVLFLLMAGTYGELMQEGEVSFLRMDKSIIRREFKRPAAFHLEVLQNYGFYFEYEKNGHSAEAYQSCDAVRMYNESCLSLFPALTYFISRIPVMDSKKDYAMQADLFLRTDFETALLGAGKRKEDINPLRPDILRSLGPRADLWQELVSVLVEEQRLTASCKFWFYCTPHWIIHLTRKGKPVCIFTIHTDGLFFEMAAPFEQLETLAEEKERLVPALRKSMEQFGCIGCGRCGGENISLVNGISLCSKEPWARRFTFEITDAAEAKAVMEMVGA